MFEQIITLVSEKLGIEAEHPVDFDEEALKVELDLLHNIKGSILEMEVADEGQEVDPMDTLKESPNILFFKDSEAGFLNAAIQTKKLIDQIVHLNVPTGGGGIDFSQLMTMQPAPEGEVIDAESVDVAEPSETEDESVEVEQESPVEE